MNVIEQKTGFNASEARDDAGRWTAGGGGILPPARIVTHAGEVRINPGPTEIGRMLSNSPTRTVRVITIGDNIAAGSGNMTHVEVWHALQGSGHVLGNVADGFDTTKRYVLTTAPEPSDHFLHEVGGLNVGIEDTLGQTVPAEQLPQTLRAALGKPAKPADVATVTTEPLDKPNGATQPPDKPAGLIRSVRRWFTATDAEPARQKSASGLAEDYQWRASGPPAASSYPEWYKSDPSQAKELIAMLQNTFAAPIEIKFLGEPDSGEIEGYASIYGNLDGHGDVVEPGAFDVTLAEHKARGTMPLMYGEHSPYKQGGDPYPIGIWDRIESDSKGLRVKGRLIGLDHPDVRRVWELIKAKAMRGISIAYNVTPGGAVVSRTAGEAKRLLKSVRLISIDLTSNPSNPGALIDGIKQFMQKAEKDTAVAHVQAAMALCDGCMAGNDAPTAEERMRFLTHLQEAHHALTGQPIPDTEFDPDAEGILEKSYAPTVRQFESWLRDGVSGGKRQLSRKEAREIGNLVFRSPRDEAREPEQKAADEALSLLAGSIAGFSLIPR